jgi:hypothetical protein
MTSAALVMMRAERRRLEEATDRAVAAGGSIKIVPSPEPSAPGPFDFRRSDSLAGAAYRRTKLWLATDVRLGEGRGRFGTWTERDVGVPTGGHDAGSAMDRRPSDGGATSPDTDPPP